MLSNSTRQFNEANEAFGAAPENLALHEVGNLIVSLVSETDIEPGLRQAMSLAETAEGDLYTKVLDAAFATGMGSADAEAVRAFFHAAALFGEARYVSRFLSELHLRALLHAKPVTDAH